MHLDSLRSYVMYVPPTYTGETPWPLVINYHGLLTDPALQIERSLMNPVADTAGYLVAYPLGLDTEIPGFPVGAGWNLPGLSGPQDDLVFTDSLLAHIQDRYTIDAERIHATGWSNGLFFSFYLACNRSDVFASVAGAAATMTRDLLAVCDYERPVSTLFFHGTADPIVPYEGSDLVASAEETYTFIAEQYTCGPEPTVTEVEDIVSRDSTTVTQFDWNGCDDDAELRFYRVNDGGHTWPSGGSPPSPAPLGFVNEDVNASAEMLAFFDRNPMPPRGSWVEGSFMQGDSLRTYRLYVPAAYDGSEPLPLVINYHGYSLDGAFQTEVDRMAVKADVRNVLLVYPDGLIVDDPFDGPGFGWNFDGRLSTMDDVQFTNALIDELTSDYTIDPHRIHATGWSMGSQMLWALACELSDRIASVAGVSGPIDEAYQTVCSPLRPMSALLLHGTEDLFFPPEGVEVNGYSFGNPQETIAFMAELNGCDAAPLVTLLPDSVVEDSTTVEVYEYGGCAADAEVTYFSLVNGGHTWPGGSFPGGQWPAFLGHVNRDIDASALILDFFDRNPMPETVTSVDAALPDASFQIHPYPNPFAGAFSLDLSAPAGTRARISLVNVLGQEVLLIHDRMLPAGSQRIQVDVAREGLPAGLYFIRAVTGQGTLHRPVVHVR